MHSNFCWPRSSSAKTSDTILTRAQLGRVIKKQRALLSHAEWHRQLLPQCPAYSDSRGRCRLPNHGGRRWLAARRCCRRGQPSGSGPVRTTQQPSHHLARGGGGGLPPGGHAPVEPLSHGRQLVCDTPAVLCGTAAGALGDVPSGEPAHWAPEHECVWTAAVPAGRSTDSPAFPTTQRCPPAGKPGPAGAQAGRPGCQSRLAGAAEAQPAQPGAARAAAAGGPRPAGAAEPHNSVRQPPPQAPRPRCRSPLRGQQQPQVLTPTLGHETATAGWTPRGTPDHRQGPRVCSTGTVQYRCVVGWHWHSVGENWSMHTEGEFAK